MMVYDRIPSFMIYLMRIPTMQSLDCVTSKKSGIIAGFRIRPKARITIFTSNDAEKDA